MFFKTYNTNTSWDIVLISITIVLTNYFVNISLPFKHFMFIKTYSKTYTPYIDIYHVFIYYT